jgi:TetR/AcrR family transcriptional regulator, transcriptional repressor for nem operon
MDMKTMILDSAQRLIQQRGANGFSYADIAKEVGVSKPSLHHHFATKSELVGRLMERYTEQLIEYLDSFNRKSLSAKDKISGYCDLYRSSLDHDRVCLGGMLSAEALTLETETQPLLPRFFEYQQQWLSHVLDQGKATGEFHLKISANNQAVIMMAALQGALIICRASKTKAPFEQSVKGLLSSIE